jgi:hypothetical protein
MRLVISLDASGDGAGHLAAAALAALGPAARGASIQLVSVLPPPTLAVPHPSPVATAAAVAEMLEVQVRQGEGGIR